MTLCHVKWRLLPILKINRLTASIQVQIFQIYFVRMFKFWLLKVLLTSEYVMFGGVVNLNFVLASARFRFRISIPDPGDRHVVLWIWHMI